MSSDTGLVGHIQPTGALLQHFFSSCERSFRFLEQRHGYTFFCGLVEYQNNYKIIKPFNQEHYDGSFNAVTRYEKGDQAIEINYSSDQFAIEACGFYNPINRLELCEVMTAARKTSPALEGDWGVTDETLLQNSISSLAQAVEKYARVLLEPSDKLLNRALTIRDKRLEQTIRQMHQTHIDDACRDAAKAYRQRDFRNVVRLLEPHKRYLKRGDLKKLERAKKSLLS
ncbi:MAG: hypothetical protein H6861_04000 [Rhodospirillales bacterium]|nr:hypothetical protein [Rhodospirillales bacterium]